MFTGIIEGLGTVERVTSGDGSASLRVKAPVAEGAAHGASIAINGVCLTVTEPQGVVDGVFTADVMGETLTRTSLGSLTTGDTVNVERAMPAGGRLDGHIVQGHVDGVGEISSITEHPEWTTLRVNVPANLSPYIVEKGSVTLNGVSLTIAALSEPDHAATHGTAWLEVGLIPETLRLTTFGTAAVGTPVNIEVDILGKYLERLVAHQKEGINA